MKGNGASRMFGFFPSSVTVSILIILTSFPSNALSNFILNQTGGSFPNSVYLQTTFSYNFVEPSVSLSYYGPSSTVGKCNAMGYWHTGNNGLNENVIPLSTKQLDQAICTDKCSLATCGYTPRTNASYALAGTTYNKLTVRRDASSRTPLTDIGASDGLLSAADYMNFPDLQMLPAVAGAVVPIYNIPELTRLHIVDPLILSRSSLVNIFMGKITVSFHMLWSLYGPSYSFDRYFFYQLDWYEIISYGMFFIRRYGMILAFLQIILLI